MKRNKAIQVLSHYMRMAFTESGLDWDYDNESDIELIVDNIISAAKEEIIQELKEKGVI
jgi:hypothetical protein